MEARSLRVLRLGSQKFIEDSLEWAGIECDESPKNPGKYGPYNQSERKEIYSKYVDVLIEKGAAYYAFDTKEKLDFHSGVTALSRIFLMRFCFEVIRSAQCS